VAIGGGKRRRESGEKNLKPHSCWDISCSSDHVEQTINEEENVKGRRRLEGLGKVAE
jgi:hypothetical protein